MKRYLKPYHNPFRKHIEKLEKMKEQLDFRQSTGGMTIGVTPNQEEQLDIAARFIKVAIDTLENMPDEELVEY